MMYLNEPLAESPGAPFPSTWYSLRGQVLFLYRGLIFITPVIIFYDQQVFNIR